MVTLSDWPEGTPMPRVRVTAEVVDAPGRACAFDDRPGEEGHLHQRRPLRSIRVTYAGTFGNTAEWVYFVCADCWQRFGDDPIRVAHAHGSKPDNVSMHTPDLGAAVCLVCGETGIHTHTLTEAKAAGAPLANLGR